MTARVLLPKGWVHVNGGSVTYAPLLNVSLWSRVGISAEQASKGIPVGVAGEVVFLSDDPDRLGKQLESHPHLARELGVKRAA
ncbi:MAG: hypothetical protein ACYC8S_03705 [Minisyncoccota bacterium]